MAKCKWCDRSGLFFSVNSQGLCNNCSPSLNMDIKNHVRAVLDLAKEIEDPRYVKYLDTSIYRLGMLIENVQYLMRYEEKGISTIEPSPSKILKDYAIKKDKIIKNGLICYWEEAKKKSETGLTLASKINPLSKILLQINEYMDKVNDKKVLISLEKDVKSIIQNTQLNIYLEQAKKAEFKKQKKKALDQYYEALYFLRHDDIDDTSQKDVFFEIEKKIIELGGTIN